MAAATGSMGIKSRCESWRSGRFGAGVGARVGAGVGVGVEVGAGDRGN